MLSYLARRHLLLALLAPLVAYSLVLYAPGGVVEYFNSTVIMINRDILYGDSKTGYYGNDYPCTGCRGFVEDWCKRPFDLCKPWPLNYAAYLFDPTETTTVDAYGNTVPKGLDVNLFGWHIKGSGALTGDFGKSLWIARYVPVSELFGPGLGGLFAATWGLLVLLILAATLQQRRRARVYIPPGKASFTPPERAFRLIVLGI